MSYVIEYDRQFIKSGLGITPLWLSGDSNVWEGRGRHERRARSWSVFLNQLGVSEEKLLEKAETLTGGKFQEHWQKNGKWVDDEGLRRWVRSGCRNAASIEDICEANDIGGIGCHLIEWHGYERSETHEKGIITTAHLDEWITEVLPYMEKSRAAGNAVYPYFDFYTNEPLKHPHPKMPSDELVLIKMGKKYLATLNAGRQYSCAEDIQKAQIFTREEAEKLCERWNLDEMKGTRIISESNALKAKYIVAFSCGSYIEKCTSSTLYITSNPTRAFLYADEATARKATSSRKATKYCETRRCTVSVIPATV